MLILLLLLVLAGCGGPDAAGAVPAADKAVPSTPSYRYNRDYVFLAPADSGGPVVVPFAFTSTETGAGVERGVRGWLARGATWDRFLDETAERSGAGGVWRVVPFPDLMITADSPSEVAAFDFAHAERKLRLEMRGAQTDWVEPSDTRFRLLDGRLTIGSESVNGTVLEILQVDSILADGWPPGEDFDALFLTSGDSIQLVMAESIGRPASDDSGYAWLRTSDEASMWDSAEVRWLEVRPHPAARRDVPYRWSFRVPGAGIQGELEALGYDAVLGPEREGRRAVEVRYTVTGWAQFDDERVDVTGTIRHRQQ